MHELWLKGNYEQPGETLEWKQKGTKATPLKPSGGQKSPKVNTVTLWSSTVDHYQPSTSHIYAGWKKHVPASRLKALSQDSTTADSQCLWKSLYAQTSLVLSATQLCSHDEITQISESFVPFYRRFDVQPYKNRESDPERYTTRGGREDDEFCILIIFIKFRQEYSSL